MSRFLQGASLIVTKKDPTIFKKKLNGWFCFVQPLILQVCYYATHYSTMAMMMTIGKIPMMMVMKKQVCYVKLCDRKKERNDKVKAPGGMSDDTIMTIMIIILQI